MHAIGAKRGRGRNFREFVLDSVIIDSNRWEQMQISLDRGWAADAAVGAVVLAVVMAGPGAAATQAKGLKAPVVISGAGSRGCLAIHQASRSRGKSAVIADCHGKASQQWVQPSLKQLQARHSGMCLEILNANKKRGAPVIQSACLKDKSQQWYVTAKGEIRSKLNHMCLSVQSGGGRVTMNGCNGSPNQIWELKKK